MRRNRRRCVVWQDDGIAINAQSASQMDSHRTGGQEERGAERVVRQVEARHECPVRRTRTRIPRSQAALLLLLRPMRRWLRREVRAEEVVDRIAAAAGRLVVRLARGPRARSVVRPNLYPRGHRVVVVFLRERLLLHRRHLPLATYSYLRGLSLSFGC